MPFQFDPANNKPTKPTGGAGKYSIGGLKAPTPPTAPKPDAGGAGLGGLLLLAVGGFVVYKIVS